MFETFLGHATALVNFVPFTAAAWAVIGTLCLFVWLFSRANNDPKSLINWEHLIVDSSNDRASPYKMGFLVGGLVSTWIVVTLTDKGDLSFDIFGLYLTYLLGGAGFNSFFKSKGGESNPATPQDEVSK